MSKQVAARADRRIKLVGIIAFALAGAVLAWTMPLVASKHHSTDMWFVGHDGTATSWVLLGLLFAWATTTAVRALPADRRRGRRAQPKPQRELPMPADPNPLTPRERAGDTLPLELVAQVQCRDRDLFPVAHTTARLVYLPPDPHALHLYISEPGHPEFWAESHRVVSRDAFISAGHHGVSLPGFDITMTQVTRDRATPILRIALYETDPAIGELGGHTGYVLHLDFDLNRELQGYLERIMRAVPPGSECEHLDVDGAISQLLGAQR